MATEGVSRFVISVAGGVILCTARARAYNASSDFIPRNYSGIGNNIEFPAWGSVGTTQIHAVADADYADDAFTPPGDDRPTAREVMSDVFLASKSKISTKSALFVAWGQLLTYDISYTIDNSTEPFNITCNDIVDVWCPLGAASDAISFNRSDAGVTNSGRSPINYATAYMDLDFVYGRSEEEAQALRTLEGGLMNVTDSGVPFQNDNGTWLIADQRTAKFPVTFALHAMLLMDHNLCCVEIAPGLGYEGDEDIYQVCRGRTIATFQHITANDFIIHLLGDSILSIGLSAHSSSYSSTDDGYPARRDRRRMSRSLTNRAYSRDEVGLPSSPQSDGHGAVTVEGRQEIEDGTHLRPDYSLDVSLGGASRGTAASPREERRRLYNLGDYDDSINAAADVFALTTGTAVFESAIPATVRVVSEGYLSMDDDNIELTVASDDIASLFERNDVGNILRGAVLSPALAVDTYYAAAVTNLSPLFKLPVDAVQRGRDHGLPTYNDAREAYNLTLATNFTEVTSDAGVAVLLSAAYGGEIDNLDAVTGALAESSATTVGVFGELLNAIWSDQLYRTTAGDRLYHLHSRPVENVEGTLLSDVIERTTNVTDLPLSVFQVPGITVCSSDSVCTSDAEVTLSDSFGLSWQDNGDDAMFITLMAKDIGDTGMLGIGWGGLTMFTAQDYVICEVFSADGAECIDRSSVSTRSVPSPDLVDPYLEVTEVSIEGEWTAVTFLRPNNPLDEEDYDLDADISAEADTEVIYSFRSGAGVGQHPNANRGAATVNFATASVETVCDDTDFVPLHGALMLIAWLLIAPMGIYFIRYRRGETVEWTGHEWYEMHEELMIVASEAVLPLGITAVFASGGNHNSSHAHWGYYMITAVAAQIFTGQMRIKGLEAKHANFSFLHRCNKYFHIWAGRFAYLAGVVQCYRGLELVSGQENLLFSAGEGLDLELGSFDMVRDYLFPVWFAFIGLSFVLLEFRKQYHRFDKGVVKGCGHVEVINGDYMPEDRNSIDRLMPRTEDLPIYTITEFNEKVLNGQSWVLVDGAILDVSNFSHRHPGGARLIRNALGTDITQEMLGEDLSVGHAMSFTPYRHPESAWGIARSLVVGYIEEEEDNDEGEGEGESELERAHEHKEAKEEQRRASSNKSPLVQMASRPVTLMPNSRLDINMAKKADRLNSLAVIPDLPLEANDHRAFLGQPKALGKAEQRGLTNAGVSTSLPAETVVTEELEAPSRTTLKRPTSIRRVLEHFHVCPLLLRERMGNCTSSTSNSRPVYRYVFQCPGQAQALVEAIAGACCVNMRAKEQGKSVIQRPYNAYAVRVHGMAPPTPGGGVKPLRGTGTEGIIIVPAGESTEGMLCIEMRIRLHPDGAMSKLLDRLGDDPDNPAVQLQGPFIFRKLVPPPAHRNVIMIAAGTGVNPMTQLIRNYLDLPRDPSRSSRSRLALVWQSVSEADLYGVEDITALKDKSNGLLEVIVLIGGERRKRNVPGAAFRVTKDKLRAARNTTFPANPALSSTAVVGISTGSRWGNQTHPLYHSEIEDPPAARGSGKGISSRPKELTHPRRKGSNSSEMRDGSDMSNICSDLIRGKVSRDVMKRAFGEHLLDKVKACSDPHVGFQSNGSGLVFSEYASNRTRVNEGEANDGGILKALCGDETTPGEIQVVVSGPSGFVAHVKNILADMGVPSEAIVPLD